MNSRFGAFCWWYLVPALLGGYVGLVVSCSYWTCMMNDGFAFRNPVFDSHRVANKPESELMMQKRIDAEKQQTPEQRKQAQLQVEQKSAQIKALVEKGIEFTSWQALLDHGMEGFIPGAALAVLLMSIAREFTKFVSKAFSAR